MNTHKLLLSILLLIFTANSVAFGCVCIGPENPKDALKNWSDTVFFGEIISISGNILSFKVESVWKGVSTKEITVSDFNIGSDCASTEYKIGAHYIIFANSRNERGESFKDDQNNPILVADTCSWISNLAGNKAKKVLKKIGKGKPVN